jgi:hypothetical protein
MSSTWVRALESLIGRGQAANDDDVPRVYTAAVLDATREELDRADKKAAILLAGTGVAIGALLSGLLAGSWTPSMLDNKVEWAWWLGVILAAAAVGALGSAVFPRISRPGNRDLVAYFGDVQAYPKHADLKAALIESSRLDLDRLTDQLSAVSAIVQRKYCLIQWALWLLLAAASLDVCSVLAGLVFFPPSQ